ncbi:MAG: hypothetical protein IJE43_07305 [Alphaproteobacteria bacterium]|nr:hypothetical protein [Alphaproteobacteria bacterium]
MRKFISIISFALFIIFPYNALCGWGALARAIKNFSNVNSAGNLDTVTHSVVKGSKGLKYIKPYNNVQEREYYPNGNIKLEVIKKGENYYAYTYYENGILEGEVHLTEDGNATAILYYPEGEIKGKSVGIYQKGEFSGEVKKYYRNGNIRQSWQLKNGKYIGLWQEYYENGTIAREIYL